MVINDGNNGFRYMALYGLIWILIWDTNGITILVGGIATVPRKIME